MPRRALACLTLLTATGCQEYEVTAQKRVLSTSQATFDAGMVAVNDRETLDILLYSTGPGDVTISDIQVEDQEHWSISPGWQSGDGDDDDESLVLNGGSEDDPDTAYFEVVFRPADAAQYRTVLTVVSNDNEVTERTDDGSGVWKIVLRGIGRYPCGNVYPAFHDFGPRAAGGYFSTEATIENCGGVILTIADFNPVGSPSFSVQDSTPVYVLPGDATTIDVAFEPAGGRPPASAEIALVSNDPDLGDERITVVGNDCTQSVSRAWDNDADGWFACGGDCDDTDGAINPSVPERPGNGADDDCDGEVDEVSDDLNNVDDDGDGLSEDDGDCHDGDASIFPSIGGAPGAPEVLNGIDDDCDGRIDEGTEWFDDDGDGLSERAGDCDDADDLIYPGAQENQNEIDDDCDGQIDEGFYTFDDDFDGFAEAEASGEGDCNDDDPWTFPGADEDCDDRDNDCDGEIDEGEDGTPNGACGFLVEREATDQAPPKGCSAIGGAGALAAGLAGLIVVGRRRA